MRYGLILAAVAVSFAPAAFSAEPSKINYECGALKFDVEYAADGKSLTMHKVHKLEKQAAEAGIHYSNARGAELRGKSRTEDVEIKPGEERTFIKCQKIVVVG